MIFHEFVVSFFRVRNATLFLASLVFCGCSMVGPQSITAGRGAYTEVINRTEDEQILNALVRQRYDETFGMISVAGITASLQFSALAATDIGIGDSDNYAGNLVPFSAGVGYEENPTISYVPLSGEDFIRRMLTPVSASEWILLGQNVKHPGHVLSLAANRINGLRNPLREEGSPSPEFTEFVMLYDLLRRIGVLDVVQASRNKGEINYLLVIHDYENAHFESVRKLLDLIGVEVKLDGSRVFVPIVEAVGSSTSEIYVHTRSALEILQVFGACIEIPPPHLENGIVEPNKWALPERRQVITIHSSKKLPDNATVRVRYRDWWFYIDATDLESKRAFMFLRTFIGMRLADPAAGQKAPVITVPVR